MKINPARLRREIDELARISECPPPAVTRVLFSEADLRARRFVKELCLAAGLAWRQDAVGNMFARWHGTDKELPAAATGSHIDAIPNAGKYDGVVGVLGGIEAIRALQQSGFRPKRSIELIIFTAEEPTRFGLGCLGSRMLGGVLSAEKAAALRSGDGQNLKQWLDRGGFAGGLDSVPLPKNHYAAFVELHIEQGPVLERRKTDIGVVQKIAAPASLRISLTGAGGHAGATLMPGRRDALLAAAEIALAVEQAALSSASRDAVATTGVLQIEPGAVNSIPAAALMEIDVRDTSEPDRDAALRQIERVARQICIRRKIFPRLEPLNADPPAACDAKLGRAIFRASKELGLTSMKLVSRAYHDTLFMARICPVSMIFIPCRGGISHRPDEYASPAAIENGVRVLAGVLAEASEK